MISDSERRLSAIMFTDMVGYSALSQRDEAEALKLLDEHNQLIRALLPAHRGNEIKTVGDAFLIEFPSALDASRCALAIQEAFRARNAESRNATPIRVRIGVHLGDVVYRGGDVFGDGVNIAARIESVAAADGICVSEDVARQVRNKVDANLVDLGRGELKNIDLPVRVYSLERPGASASAAVTRRRGFPRAAWVSATLALVLIALAFGASQWERLKPQGDGLSNVHDSIAVLPFVDLSPNKDHEYFGDGLAEEVLNLLTRIPELKVIARTSSFSFKGKNTDIATIAKSLGVGTVLEGSVRRSSGRVRITAQLIRASDSAHLWSQNFDREMVDTLLIQDEIAKAVVDALKLKLGAGHALPATPHRAANPEAFDQYMLGRYLLARSGGDNLEKAHAALARSVELDPKFAQAYALLASAEHRLSVREGEGPARAKREAAADEFAETAIRLEPSFGEAYAVRAWLRMSRYEWDKAGTDLELAQRLDPNSARVNTTLGTYRAALGQLSGALDSYKRATEVDPLFAPPWFDRGRLSLALGDPASARSDFSRFGALASDSLATRFGLALTDLIDGKAASVRSRAETFAEESDKLMLLCLTEHTLGNQDASDRAFESYKRMRPNNYYNQAQLHAWRGNTAQALELLEQARLKRYTVLLKLRIDPLMRRLRGDPGYEDFLKRMGLPPTSAEK